MNILILATLKDLEIPILNTNILDITIKNFKKGNNLIKIYSPFSKVRDTLDKKLILKMDSFSKSLEYFKNLSKPFLLISKVAIANIDYEKLFLYHTNHHQACTLVCRNLVADKTIPIFKFNDKKEIVSINKRRYASCGIHILDASLNFTEIKNLSKLINKLIEDKNLKGFVHKGYFYRQQQKFEGLHHKVVQRTYIK